MEIVRRWGGGSNQGFAGEWLKNRGQIAMLLGREFNLCSLFPHLRIAAFRAAKVKTFR